MGRRKTIDQDGILEAALRTIKREGAAHMSIDAVANEAGICKASVLYGFKTKQGLIHALMRQQMALYEDRIDAAREALCDGEDTEVRALIDAADFAFSDDDRAAAINLCAALVHDDDLRGIVRENFRKHFDAVRATARCPRGAVLAFFALEGLMSFERLGLNDWSKEERRALLDDIIWLAGQEPAPAVA